MKVYLIRRIETKGVLGIYWANSISALWDTIDEVGDPGIYEYTVLRDAGGLFFPDEEPVIADYDNDDENADDADISWAEAVPSECFSEAIFFQDRYKWIAMPHTDEPGGMVHEAFVRLVRKKHPGMGAAEAAAKVEEYKRDGFRE